MAWEVIHQYNDGTAAQLDPTKQWRLSDITLNNGVAVSKEGCMVCCVAIMKKGKGDDTRCAYDVVYDLAKQHTGSDGKYDNSDSYSRSKSNLPAIVQVPNQQHYVVATSSLGGNKYKVLDPGSSSNTEMVL